MNALTRRRALQPHPPAAVRAPLPVRVAYSRPVLKLETQALLPGLSEHGSLLRRIEPARWPTVTHGPSAPRPRRPRPARVSKASPPAGQHRRREPPPPSPPPRRRSRRAPQTSPRHRRRRRRRFPRPGLPYGGRASAEFGTAVLPQSFMVLTKLAD